MTFPLPIPKEAIEAGAKEIDARLAALAVERVSTKVQTAILELTAEEVISVALPFLQFSPVGDNHHNAKNCPYCSPGTF